MERSVNEIAKAAGVTSRTLRHYHDIGLLEPSRVGHNGYRYYDDDAMVRLQRILLLRDLGLALPQVATVIDGHDEPAAALGKHLKLLENERERITRRIRSVRSTMQKLHEGEPLMASEVFDGFDHTQYKEEVTQRWGAEAYESGDQWWRSLTREEKAQFQQEQKDIAADFVAAHADGESPDSSRTQAITHRHYQWMSPSMGNGPIGAEQFSGIGELYVSDPRFAQNYGAEDNPGATEFNRDAMRIYAQRHLT